MVQCVLMVAVELRPRFDFIKSCIMKHDVCRSLQVLPILTLGSLRPYLPNLRSPLANDVRTT